MASRILSVGYDVDLMKIRSRVLSSAGYLVKESYSVETAIELAESDLIDVVVICHTVPEADKQLLIESTRSKRRLLPLLCLSPAGYTSSSEGCSAVDNNPVGLLNALKSATKPPTMGLRG